MTLEEGLSRGEVIVREQGAEALVRDRDGGRPAVQNYGGPSVNQLVLINRSKRPLLLLAGELVSGGKQDRIIGKDRIVPVGAEPLPLDVFCVEHGRWSSGSQFTAAKTIVHPSVREQAAVNQKQGDVWASVAAGSTAQRSAAAPAPQVTTESIEVTMQSEAPTQSYDKIYGSRRVAPSVDAMVDEVQRRFRKQTGGTEGRTRGGRGDRVWRRSGVERHFRVEMNCSTSIGASCCGATRWRRWRGRRCERRRRRKTAQEFLQRLKGREQTESEPGVYVWREINEGRLSQIELDALQPKVMTLHRLVVRKTS